MATGPRGIVGAPVTPFTRDNRIDLDSFARQVEFLIRNGVHALAHPMHIGESLNLTVEERRELARRLVQVAAGRVPVLVNVSAAGTDQALEFARYAASIAASGIVLLPPYHWKPSREALVDHFVTVAGIPGITLVAYNNVGATAVEITPAVVRQLMETLPSFVGLKDASFDMRYFTEVCRLTAEVNPEFAVYTGIEYLLSSMPLGGAGAFSAAAEVAPRLTLALYESCAAGDVKAARPLQHRMSALLELLMQNYPATIKHAMEVMGRPVGPTRKPIPPLSADAQARVRDVLGRLGVLDDEPRGW